MLTSLYSFNYYFVWQLVLFFLILSVLCYVFYCFGLYTIAKRRQLNKPGLAFVPVVNYYILGSIADQYDMLWTGRNIKLKKVLLWLGAGFISVYVLFFCLFVFGSNAFEAVFIWFPFLFLLLFPAGIVLIVFQFIALHKVYRSCTPDNAVVLIVLSIIFSIITPFVLFAIRNSDKGLPFMQPNQQI